MQTADQLLLERWRAEGDAEAFREITARYAGLVYAAAKRVLKDASDAEDVAQECFEALALRRDAAPIYLGAWLHTVATNRALNYLDAAQRRRAREQRATAAAPEYTRTEWDDLYEHVDAAIAELPEDLHAAIVGHFLEGRSKVDLARALGVSRPAIHYRIDKGLEQVRHTLRRKGVTASASAFGAAMAAQASEVVPASLIAGLGKLSMIGVPAIGATTTPMVAATFAGSIVMKKALIFGAAIIAMAGGSAIFLRQQPPAPAAPPPVAPVEQESDMVFGTRTGPAPEAALVIAPLPESLPQTGPETIPPDPNAIRVKPGRGDAGRGDLVIAGRVVDNDAKPVQGAGVTIRGNGIAVAAVSEVDGSFRVTGLAPGQYEGIATHQFFSKATLDAVEGGDEAVVFELQGRVTVIVSGRVVDERTGLAVTRFSIHWKSGNFVKGGKGFFSQESHEIDDLRGQFELTQVETGNSTILVQASGHAASFTPINLETTDPIRDLVIEVQQGMVVEGRVTDHAGNPVAGASVFSSSPSPVAELKKYADWSEEGRKNLFLGVDAKSDEAGNFIINTLSGDEPELFATHPVHGTGRAPIVWSGESPIRGVSLVLENTTGVAEVLVSVDGKPANDLNVIVAAPGGRGIPHQTGTTGPDGRETLTDLPEGLVGVVAYFPVEQQQFPQRVIVDTIIEPGKTAQIVIDYKPGTATLEGVVGLGEQTATGGYLDLSIAEGNRKEPSRVQVGSDGTYRFEGLPPGEASIKVAATFGEIWRTQLISVSIADGSHQQVDIDFGNSGTLQGVVSGMPVDAIGFAIALHGEHVIEENTPDLIRSINHFIVGRAQFEADGAYLIEGISPGRHTLLVSVAGGEDSGLAEGPRVVTAVVEVVDGETTTTDFDMSE